MLRRKLDILPAMRPSPSMRAWPKGHAEGLPERGALTCDDVTIRERPRLKECHVGKYSLPFVPKHTLTCGRAATLDELRMSALAATQ